MTRFPQSRPNTRTLIGGVGAGRAEAPLAALARQLGAQLAGAGYAVVCGGRGGVMEAACRGAQEAGGLTVGILPGDSHEQANPYVTIPVVTDMGHARNIIVAHTARVLVAVGGCHGTRSEVSIALTLGRTVISLDSFDFDPAIVVVRTPEEAVQAVRRALEGGA